MILRVIYGCMDHIAEIQLILIHAKMLKNLMYITTLDCKDDFDSVINEILEQDLEKLGIQECLKDAIMDPYSYFFIRIWKTNEAFFPINIIKEAKRGCPLSQLFCHL
jgi:hypothetical protein